MDINGPPKESDNNKQNKELNKNVINQLNINLNDIPRPVLRRTSAYDHIKTEENTNNSTSGRHLLKIFENLEKSK
jgi:hypothetical protein